MTMTIKLHTSICTADWYAIEQSRAIYGQQGRPTIVLTRQHWDVYPPRTDVTYTARVAGKAPEPYVPTPLSDFDF